MPKAIAKNPDGSPPNFVDPPSLLPAFYIVSITMIVVSLGFVLMRIYFQYGKNRKLQVEDYFCIFSWILMTGYAITGQTMGETARHVWDIPITAYDSAWVKKNAALSVIYPPAIWLAKSAILILYIRLFNPFRWCRWTCISAIFILGCFYLGTLPVWIVYCFPHGDEKWDIYVAIKAAKSNNLAIAFSIIGVISDVFILVLPLPVIYQLQLSNKSKLALSGIFLTAAFGIASSCVALYFRSLVILHTAFDSPWYTAGAFICVIVEAFVTIIISCAPTVPWKVIFDNVRSYPSRKSRTDRMPSSSKAYRLESITNANQGQHDSSRSQPTNKHPTAQVHAVSVERLQDQDSGSSIDLIRNN